MRSTSIWSTTYIGQVSDELILWKLSIKVPWESEVREFGKFSYFGIVGPSFWCVHTSYFHHFDMYDSDLT